MSEKDLPDNVAPNPHSLPYASNVGAPIIRPEHSLGGWKIGAVHNANKHYEERFNKLKKEFEELSKDFKWNEKHMLKDEYIVGIFGKTSKIGLNQFGFILLKSLKPTK